MELYPGAYDIIHGALDSLNHISIIVWRHNHQDYIRLSTGVSLKLQLRLSPMIAWAMQYCARQQVNIMTSELYFLSPPILKSPKMDFPRTLSETKKATVPASSISIRLLTFGLPQSRNKACTQLRERNTKQTGKRMAIIKFQSLTLSVIVVAKFMLEIERKEAPTISSIIFRFSSILISTSSQSSKIAMLQKRCPTRKDPAPNANRPYPPYYSTKSPAAPKSTATMTLTIVLWPRCLKLASMRMRRGNTLKTARNRASMKLRRMQSVPKKMQRQLQMRSSLSLVILGHTIKIYTQSTLEGCFGQKWTQPQVDFYKAVAIRAFLLSLHGLMQQNLSQEELVFIVNNTDKRYEYAGKDYILLIKDEPHRPCSILLSDCEEAIWSKLVDLSFFATLKRELQLASPLKVFAAHFVKSLQSSSYIEKDRSAIKIFIELEIGEGLMMASSIRVETRVHYNNPDEFKKTLRKFTTALWDVKNCQLKRQKEKEELGKLQQQKKAEEEEEEQRKIKNGYGKKAQVGRNHMMKKGDLMNPERKKRKKLGAKLGTGYEQDMFLPNTTPTASIYSTE